MQNIFCYCIVGENVANMVEFTYNNSGIMVIHFQSDFLNTDIKSQYALGISRPYVEKS